MAGIRRTWDKEYYAAKARERLEGGVTQAEETKQNKIPQREEFQPADKDADGPMGSDRAFLHARSNKIDFDEKVGKVEIIKAGQANSSHGPGYWCETCQCLLKDSASYLSHINGKNHQRALGYSMRVERVEVDRVKERLEALKRKRVEEAASSGAQKPSAIAEYDSRMAEKALKEELEKKKKKEEKELRRKELEAIELEAVDPDIASLMGFGGFGTSKSK